MDKNYKNKDLMNDPQYLDNTYDQYYFVPIPDCSYFDDKDEEQNHTVPVQDGTFVEKEWANNGCPEDE